MKFTSVSRILMHRRRFDVQFYVQITIGRLLVDRCSNPVYQMSVPGDIGGKLRNLSLLKASSVKVGRASQ